MGILIGKFGIFLQYFVQIAIESCEFCFYLSKSDYLPISDYHIEVFVQPLLLGKLIAPSLSRLAERLLEGVQQCKRASFTLSVKP